MILVFVPELAIGIFFTLASVPSLCLSWPGTTASLVSRMTFQDAASKMEPWVHEEIGYHNLLGIRNIEAKVTTLCKTVALIYK